MAYARKGYSIKKRSFKKVTRKVGKRSAGISKGSKALVSLIKKVALKPVETKNTHFIEENIQLYHNVPQIVYDNLNTTQAVTENNTGTSNFACRVGDKVIARGLSYKFWFANKLDRPNVMYKIIFYKYRSNTVPTAPYYAQGTSNYMIRDIDVEKYKIIKIVNFNLQTSAQKLVTGDTFGGAEGHRAVSVWLPMNNQQIVYENGTGYPRMQDIAYSVVCYDSFGTLITDNIASYAVNRKFYFKDP